MSGNKKQRHARVLWPILLSMVALAVLIPVLLHDKNVALFNPKGLIAQEQFNLLILIVIILFVVAVPVMIVLYFFAWKYRESNDKPVRDPKAGNSKLVNVAIWGIPSIFMIICAVILWPSTHQLEPKKAIGDAEPLTIQVIAQRWKWLFIYPEQSIATVNYVQLPIDRPVTFELTADDAPMSAFWIPNLGGMLYAMTGHTNRLNLLPEKLGEYPGRTAEINGRGFAGMTFTAKVSSHDDFIAWAQGVQQKSDVLSSDAYAELLKPSENNPPAFYSPVESGLYATVLTKYTAGHDQEGHGH